MTVDNFTSNRAVISLSGGMDSTMLLIHLLANGMEVRAYSFYYGQKHSIELKKVKRNIKFLQSKGFKIEHQIIDLESAFSGNTSSLVASTGIDIPHGHYAADNMKSTVVPLRNVIFSSIIYSKAINWAVQTGDNVLITLGLHSGDHCFTGDTKILTPDGLKTVSELKEGDMIYSFNGDKLKVEIDRCVDIIEKGTNNEIYNITTTSGKIRLTGKHKVYIVDRTNLTSKGYDKVFSRKIVEELKEGDIMITSDKLPDSLPDNKMKDEYIDIEDILYSFIKEKFPEYSIDTIDGKIGIVSTNGKMTSMIDSKLNAKYLLELMGWYITEGWTSEQYKKNPSQSRFCSIISQSMTKNNENCESISEACQNLGVSPSMSHSKQCIGNIPVETSYQFNSVMSALMQTAGNGSQNKCIPQWMMNFLKYHKEYINDFLDVMICGDGHYDKTSGMYSYSTKSHKLAEDIAFLVKLSGQYVKSTVSKYGQYIIMFGSNRRKHGLVRFGDAAMTTITKIEKENKLEKVYDISIEKNHNFFAGEYGNVLISNSIYPDCRPESQEACKNAFELSDWNSDKIDYIAPFINIDKGQVLKAGLDAMDKLGFTKTEKNKILRNTHTCYDPNEKGESCGLCGSCTERLEAFAANNMKDPIKYSNKENI